jgi:hypothetical protein
LSIIILTLRLRVMVIKASKCQYTKSENVSQIGFSNSSKVFVQQFIVKIFSENTRQ